MPNLAKFLRRYTDVPALVYMLTEKQITLLDPETWDDKNDSYFLRLYREKSKFESVLALCFTRYSETYHHWRVFAHGSGGVCVTFKRKPLIEALRKQAGIRMGQVSYLKVSDTRSINPFTKDLPFLKRAPFEHEEEFRVILGSLQKISTLDIAIPISCIDRITLSPWLHPALSLHLKKILWNIPGCRDLQIVRSTLISNEDWKSFGDSAVNTRDTRPRMREPKSRSRRTRRT
jgi:hypothetical protein